MGGSGAPSRNPPPPPWEITAEAMLGTDCTLEVLPVCTKNRGDDLADTLGIVRQSVMIHLPTRNAESNKHVPPPVPPDKKGTAVKLIAVK